MFALKVAALAVLGALVSSANAESHTIHFNNKCQGGTAEVWQNGNRLHSGNGAYTHNGPLSGAIAFLQQNGKCDKNGVPCTMLETTLINGGTSSTDITLIPPHKFSHAMSFRYKNGCEDKGNHCSKPGCHGAFHKPKQTYVQRQCNVDNVDLEVTFC